MLRKAFLWLTIAFVPAGAHPQVTADFVEKFYVPEANGFGESISVYQDTVLIGTFGEDTYVFRLAGGQWWMDRLVSPAGDLFSRDTSLDGDDGDVALVGAAPEARVFRFNGSSWILEATLDNGDPGSRFGHAVDVDGNLAVVGGRSENVHVFRFDGREWFREAVLSPPPREDGKAPYGFAERVVVDSDEGRIFVRKEQTIGDAFDGVYAFRHDGRGWYQEDAITLHEPGAKTIFHGDIALDGDVALIDEDYDDVVHVFRFDGAAWQREAILEPPELGQRGCYCVPAPAGGGERCDGSTPNFGVSVALDGDLALIGANLDDVAGTDAGAAYLYRYDGRQWVYELLLQGEASTRCSGNFGRLVSLHQGRALVRSGRAVYFFRLHRPG